jgi:hypothetical protein
MESSAMLRRVALVRTDVYECLRSVRRLLVTASVVPSSPIFDTLMNEALRSSETSVLTRAARRNIPEDSILRTPSSAMLRIVALVRTDVSKESVDSIIKVFLR